VKHLRRSQVWLVSSLALLTSCATPVTPQSGLQPGSKYVALGSSFAAGAAIGPIKPGTPARCGRTVNNYATLLADALQLALDDQSCGGATTANILEPWAELPAQMDAVDASTRLVTITIGGNDLNYVGNLFMASCAPGEIIEAGQFKVPCVKPTWPTEQTYTSLEDALNRVARDVRERAPQARLVFVQYVSLVPDAPCPRANMPMEYASENRTIGRRLAEITARVARANYASLLEADRLSLGHTPCDQAPWSNGMIENNDMSKGAPWHPNSAGHAAIASALVEMLRP